MAQSIERLNAHKDELIAELLAAVHAAAETLIGTLEAVEGTEYEQGIRECLDSILYTAIAKAERE